jgi:hypothetical protein
MQLFNKRLAEIYRTFKHKRAKIKRRKKAEAIIVGKLSLKDQEFSDLLTEIMIDCKEERGSNANEAVLQKNAELLKKLFDIDTKKD